MEVTITDTYDISKLENKNPLHTKELNENTDDNFILDVEEFKSAIGTKGYICKEI